MIYVDNFFTRAKPDEVLFECSNDFTTVQTMAESFFYHVKTEADDALQMRYKALALQHDEPIEFIEQIKMMPVEAAVRELNYYSA
ncbi:hypothetical protein [Vibrio crassostreae]|uniref:hypothetical protein n=1 Tax=Vibrio crassostreae TaxID=246167 RepID=UPI001B310FBC|nr:hypothetical protein [Vibrio crassostreae]